MTILILIVTLFMGIRSDTKIVTPIPSAEEFTVSEQISSSGYVDGEVSQSEKR